MIRRRVDIPDNVGDLPHEIALMDIGCYALEAALTNMGNKPLAACARAIGQIVGESEDGRSTDAIALIRQTIAWHLERSPHNAALIDLVLDITNRLRTLP